MPRPALCHTRTALTVSIRNLLTNAGPGQADIYKHDLKMPDAEVTVDYLLDRLVICGSVNRVVDQLLAFRET